MTSSKTEQPRTAAGRDFARRIAHFQILGDIGSILAIEAEAATGAKPDCGCKPYSPCDFHQAESDRRTGPRPDLLDALEPLRRRAADPGWNEDYRAGLTDVLREIDRTGAKPDLLDTGRIERALVEWKHRGHRIDSNGYCDDCMRFVDTQAAEDAAEIVEADARPAASKKERP